MLAASEESDDDSYVETASPAPEGTDLPEMNLWWNTQQAWFNLFIKIVTHKNLEKSIEDTAFGTVPCPFARDFLHTSFLRSNIID